jgi:hypothetical protein
VPTTRFGPAIPKHDSLAQGPPPPRTTTGPNATLQAADTTVSGRRSEQISDAMKSGSLPALVSRGLTRGVITVETRRLSDDTLRGCGPASSPFGDRGP